MSDIPLTSDTKRALQLAGGLERPDGIVTGRPHPAPPPAAENGCGCTQVDGPDAGALGDDVNADSAANRDQDGAARGRGVRIGQGRTDDARS